MLFLWWAQTNNGARRRISALYFGPVACFFAVSNQVWPLYVLGGDYAALVTCAADSVLFLPWAAFAAVAADQVVCTAVVGGGHAPVPRSRGRGRSPAPAAARSSPAAVPRSKLKWAFYFFFVLFWARRDSAMHFSRMNARHCTARHGQNYHSRIALR